MVIFAILLIVYLTFMHWINGQLMLKLISSQEKKQFIKENYFYLWFILILVGYVVLIGNITLPTNPLKLTDYVFMFLFIYPFMINSHYNPHQSFKGVFSFCIVYPIGEELLYRGILSYLLIYFFNTNTILVPFPLLKEISLTVLITAICFAIMHVQYFKFKLDQIGIRKIMYAFVFGIVVGNIIEMSGSLLYGILFHIIANSGATYFSYKRNNFIVKNG